MNRQAWVAWLMVLLQAVLFWYLSDSVVFPILVLAISAPAVVQRRRWEISAANLQWIDLGLAILCALKWYLAPHDSSNVRGFVMFPLMHAAAQFFLSVQVARLWGRRPDRPLPVYLPLLAVLVFICLGDVDVTRTQRRMYQHATLSLVGLMCAFYSLARRSQMSSSGRRYRWVRPTLILAVLLVSGWGARIGNAWLLDQWGEIERFVLQATHSRRRPPAEDAYVGFSGSAPIGSIQFLKSTRDDEVALRVLADQPPQYLRGAAFDRFLGHSWEYRADWDPSAISRSPMTDRVRMRGQTPAVTLVDSKLFALRPLADAEHSVMTIFRETDVDRFTFLPLNSHVIEAHANHLGLDRHSIVSASTLPPSAVLSVWSASETRSPAEPILQPDSWKLDEPFRLSGSVEADALKRLTELNDTVHPLVVERASSLFAGCVTVRDRLDAVRKYFANSQYQSGLRATHGRDPLTQFILERSPGHCEAFASATAVMLRIGGVPCRYVTGFTGGDFNPIGKYWVVRQRNAHAWVEAYLPDEGWIIVDNTPGEGLPTTNDRFGWWQVWDDVNLRGQMIRAVLANGSWRGTIKAIALFLEMLVTTIPGWLLTGGVLFLILRQIRWGSPAGRTSPASQTCLRLQKLRNELDQILRRLRLEREAHETLHQFAGRLQEEAQSRPPLQAAAQWYLKYAAARYDVHDKDATAESLQTELRSLTVAVKQSRK